MLQTSVQKAGRALAQRGFLGGIMSLENVSVNFGKIKALSNIHFKVDKGEIVFITGHSGAGKTTLLNILGGITRPTSGKVSTPARGGKSPYFVAPVFQNLRLISQESLESNLMTSFDPDFYRSKQEFVHDMKELAQMLGIYNYLDLKVSCANGGLKQQVAFLRAILTRPDIILADEPTASLDYDNAKKIYDVLHLYNVKRSLTVVWASHNQDLVKKFSGRIVHLDKGRIIYSGRACFI